MEPNVSPAAQLMRLIVGRWISKPVYAVAALGIADMLNEGPRSIDELAPMSRCHAPTLYRVMRALASVGIFAETDDGRFALTPMAECLRSGAMRSMALLFNSEWSDRAWARFLDTVRTGETAFEMAHGMPLAAWLEGHPEAAGVFNEANAVKASGSHKAIIDVYDFSPIGSLTDVGGGLGALISEILDANPQLKGVLAELPAVTPKARDFIRARGLGARCRVVACDFTKSIPAGSDAYLMSHILHDWPDDRCLTILSNCHRAMRPQSKLLIVEMVVPPGNQASVAKLLDMEMLAITGGRERTEAEFETLLASSGFRLSRIIPTRDEVCLIEAIRL
jgi:hypothetical protein